MPPFLYTYPGVGGRNRNLISDLSTTSPEGCFSQPTANKEEPVIIGRGLFR